MKELLSAKLIAHAIVALFGAVVYAIEMSRGRKTWSWRAFLADAVVASFTGLVFGLIAFHYLPDQTYLSLVITSVGARTGPNGMVWIIDKVRVVIEKR